MQQDPFDQALAAALSPVLDPVPTYISRTPALSNALVTLAGRDTPLVSALEDSIIHCFPYTPSLRLPHIEARGLLSGDPHACQGQQIDKRQSKPTTLVVFWMTGIVLCSMVSGS